MNKTTKMSKNVDTPSMEQLRAAVVEQELSTRSWVAMAEKMKATIAIYNMQEEYDRVVSANAEKLKSQQEAYNALIQQAMKEQGAQSVELTKE